MEKCFKHLLNGKWPMKSFLIKPKSFRFSLFQVNIESLSQLIVIKFDSNKPCENIAWVFV